MLTWLVLYNMRDWEVLSKRVGGSLQHTQSSFLLCFVGDKRAAAALPCRQNVRGSPVAVVNPLLLESVASSTEEFFCQSSTVYSRN